MNKKTIEFLWSFSLSLIVLFLGIRLGSQFKEREIFNDIVSQETQSEVIEKAKLSIEVINQHTFITNLEVMASLLSTQDDLNDMGIGGGYIGNGRIVCLPSMSYCLHEVGHAVDDFLGHPSMSRAWEVAIENYVEQCIKEYVIEWCINLIGYSGINGNPMEIVSFANSEDSFEWGGYGELYAQLFEISRLRFTPLPESIQLFYTVEWNE